MKELSIHPKRPPGRPIQVVHRVNQKLVHTHCRSIRDSNVAGFIELLDVLSSDLPEALGEGALSFPIESLVLPKLVVVAISYPVAEGADRVVLLHPSERNDSSKPEE